LEFKEKAKTSSNQPFEVVVASFTSPSPCLSINSRMESLASGSGRTVCFAKASGEPYLYKVGEVGYLIETIGQPLPPEGTGYGSAQWALTIVDNLQ
jgi:hypothetical protein